MNKRVSKDQWLQAALDSLVENGMNGIAVEQLAKQLGTSKSGFYWHFKNRDDLLEHLLGYWESEFTDTVINNISHLDENAEKKLHITSEMILKHQLGKYDMAFRTWGNESKEVRKRIKKIDRKRLNYISGLFSELGFRGEEAEARAGLFIMYHAYIDSMFYDTSATKRKNNLIFYNKLLLKK